MLDWIEVIKRSRGLADHCFDVNASYRDAVSITIGTQRCSGAGIGKIFVALQDAHKIGNKAQWRIGTAACEQLSRSHHFILFQISV